MVGRKMRFAKQRKHASLRMSAPYLCDLRGGVTIARAYLAHVAARLQIDAVHRAAKSLGLAQQTNKRLPVITPLVVIAYAGPEFLFADLAAQPFVQHILVAAKDHLQ